MHRLIVFLIMIAALTGCGKKDLAHTTFSGTVEITEHVLGAKAGGRISQIRVKEGDMVKSGEVLAVLDRYEQTQKDWQRAEDLLKSGGGNAQAVEHAKLAFEDQQIISPIDGIVLVKAAEDGEVINSGAGVVVIGDPKDQWVKIYVPEGIINQVQMNQRVHITLDGTTKSYQGHVSFIATKAEFTPRNVQTPEERVTQDFAIKVAFDNPDSSLHAGVAADIQFDHS